MDPEAYAKHNKPENGAKIGVYKHPATKEELWCQTHPYADAVVRQGWVYDRPLPSAENRRELTKSDQPKAPSVEEVKQMRADMAELKQLRAEKAAREKAEAEAKKAEASKPKEVKEETK